MKKLLLALLVLPCIAFSQKLEFGVNGGVIPYSYYKAIDQSDFGTLGKKSQSAYTIGGKVMFNLLAFQVGIGVDYSNIIYSSTYSGSWYSATYTYNRKVEDKIVSPLTSTYIFLNQKLPLPKSAIYFGLHGGFATGEMTSFDLTTTITTGKVKGFFGGLQAGYTFYITSHLGVNIDLAFRAMYMKSQYEKSSVQLFRSDYRNKNLLLTLPATIGIRYKL